MITHGERGTGQASEMGWSPWGAGWVDGERPVLVGGEARSSKSKLYAKLERESQRYSPEVVAGRFYNGASLAATAVMRVVPHCKIRSDKLQSEVFDKNSRSSSETFFGQRRVKYWLAFAAWIK